MDIFEFFYRPFRTYKKDTETKSWDRVNVLRKGEIYQEVSQRN